MIWFVRVALALAAVVTFYAFVRVLLNLVCELIVSVCDAVMWTIRKLGLAPKLPADGR